MSYEVLESVIVNSGELSESLKVENDIRKKESLVIQHILQCTSNNVKLKTDFKVGLEWFNVSTPLFLHDQLKGKIVILDFFTYCCINCMHILPHLKKLEEELSIADGLVVVGVHSAKFDNEKDSANILAAVQRYNITHPVVNDADGTMWTELGIPCWPTLLVLGPDSDVLFVAMGEGHKEELSLVIHTSINYYTNKGKLQNHLLPTAPATHLLPQQDTGLLFPGKVACWSDCAPTETGNVNSTQKQTGVGNIGNNGNTSLDWLVVSDTGHHRVLVLDSLGNVQFTVGGNEPGFMDGSFEDARFHSPQGVTFFNQFVVYVADTENHAIREVNMKTMRVSTVAGTGVQGCDYVGGKQGSQQELSSPWDVALVPCCVVNQQQLGVMLEAGETRQEQVLLVAMAGLHQIWALFLQDHRWWKGKLFLEGTCAAVAGSGKEENRNNSYPHAAGFAQPSGLAVAAQLGAVFVADSESSSVRKMSLLDGKVSAVAGGDRSPSNLFGFGDVDGKQFGAKLQHPLGVTWSNQDGLLYVADSYNHKLKVVNVADNSCRTLLGLGRSGDVCGKFASAMLNEPGGLCASGSSHYIYVADTNNHCIKVIDLKSQTVDKLAISMHPPEVRPSSILKGPSTELAISPAGGTIVLHLSLLLDDGLSFTPSAPQKWTIKLPHAGWSSNSYNGVYEPQLDLSLHVPAASAGHSEVVCVDYRLFVCRNSSECLLKRLCVSLVVVRQTDAPVTVTHHFKHVLSSHNKSDSLK